MEFLFQEEVENKKELEQILQQKSIDIPDYCVCVISMLKNTKNECLLQRRGPKSRDEHFKLEEIGGGVEETDQNFRFSVMREIQEEVGNKAQFELGNFVGAFYNKKFDYRANLDIHWLFLVYEGTYLGGELEISEPGKCLGYEFYASDKLPFNEMSEDCLFLHHFCNDDSNILKEKNNNELKFDN